MAIVTTMLGAGGSPVVALALEVTVTDPLATPETAVTAAAMVT